MVPYEARQAGHEAFAAAIAAGGVVGAALAGPFGAPAVELVSAALTGAVAAHALHASGDGHLLRRGVYRVTRDPRAPLAAHALDAALRARRGDRRALRSVAMLVGRCASAHAAAILAPVLRGWSLARDLRHAATARDPVAVDALAMFEKADNDAEEVAA